MLQGIECWGLLTVVKALWWTESQSPPRFCTASLGAQNLNKPQNKTSCCWSSQLDLSALWLQFVLPLLFEECLCSATRPHFDTSPLLGSRHRTAEAEMSSHTHTYFTRNLFNPHLNLSTVKRIFLTLNIQII